MQNEEIVQRIGFFRNKSNLSARELSLMIGKANNYINCLETRGFNIPTSVLMDIIDAFQITPEHFFAENYQTYIKDNEIYNLIKAMPSEKKESLLKFIKSSE